jgi:uncharacterized membrane protein
VRTPELELSPDKPIYQTCFHTTQLFLSAGREFNASSLIAPTLTIVVIAFIVIFLIELFTPMHFSVVDF